MKFTNWQLIAVLAILFGGITVAHFFAPSAVALIVSLLVSFFSAVFIQRKDDGDPPAGSPPTLTVLSGGAATLALLSFLLFVGCSSLGPAERTEVARIASQIEFCQEEGRACKLTEDAGTNCYDRYAACMKNAGLR